MKQTARKIILLLLIAHCSIHIANAQQPTQEWVQRYTNGNFANGLLVQLDSTGNVYVLVGNSLADSTNGDYCVLKYTSNGIIVWAAYYNGPGNLSENPTAFAVTKAGDVYVTGINSINFIDHITTVKFNANGVLQWAKNYIASGPSDYPYDIKIDKSGNIIVLGISVNNNNTSNGLTIKYDPAGDTLWVKKFSQLPLSSNFKKSVIDDLDNIYVIGDYVSNNVDFLVVKYNPNGSLLWYTTYNSPQNYGDSGYEIAIDTFNNVYALGTNSVPTASVNNTVVKLSNAGVILWDRVFTGIVPGNGRCQRPKGIVVTQDGNVIYYTTFCANGTGGGGYSIVTLKYAGNGDSIWVRQFGGGVNGTPNEPSELKLDKFNAIYITGRANFQSTGDDYATIKYLPDGIQQWVATYNGPLTNSFDYSNDLYVNSNLEVYVTGISSRFNGNPILWDAATIKYSQPIGIIHNNNGLPIDYRLEQNYPNPFNPTTQIDYQVPQKSIIKLILFNVLGQVIRTLVQTQQSSGYYSVLFHAEDLNTGIYFYSLIAEGKLIDSKKLILMK